MRKLLPDKEKVFHLHEYAVWEGEDEFYGYMTWNDKGEVLTYVTGKGMIIEDVLCFASIASEGDEATFKTKPDVDFELNQLPKWDKTKYYCAIIAGEFAALPQYCETGKPLKKGEEDYNAVKEMLEKHGAVLQ
jgi:hypothetical protein